MGSGRLQKSVYGVHRSLHRDSESWIMEKIRIQKHAVFITEEESGS